MKELILATANSGKIREFKALLSVRCFSLQDLTIPAPDETGLSFVENAILKARHASRLGHKPALADDSGLVVTALNNQPGIYSARFAGPKATAQENIALLLQRLAHVPDRQRSGYFYCALALLQHADDPCPLLACGKLDGYITKAPEGEGGFGYDPVFYLPEYQCTLAALSMEIKNTISHRALALRELGAALQAM